jgi:hypothetical protein
MAIYKETLSTGELRYVVRVKRYGKRRVVGRFDTPNEAVSAAVREYASYMAGVWLDGKEKSIGSIHD